MSSYLNGTIIQFPDFKENTIVTKWNGRKNEVSVETIKTILYYETTFKSQGNFGVEFPQFPEETVVHERNLRKKWGTHQG
jgi:hypothetical protein